ncbi:flagellar hook-length control protein FliK [Clostridium sp. ZS2-4]|uniref:flagellar hook-length control protein FliK n=1 Tax=Clostridium sp. ZS2-4 TaxID=2987703 RepID=UPI00227C3C2B|nr:flagellar hook-length control protein FliK [Clostridium sp. ZS2-4]MCY6354005.1 flagellar hook-length control protein FliK [Clostridium sp. ZS2-4]
MNNASLNVLNNIKVDLKPMNKGISQAKDVKSEDKSNNSKDFRKLLSSVSKEDKPLKEKQDKEVADSKDLDSKELEVKDAQTKEVGLKDLNPKGLEEIMQDDTDSTKELMELIQSLVSGQITLKEFLEKMPENTDTLEDLAVELGTQVVDVIKNNITMDADKVSELSKNLKSDILEILNSEPKSFQDIIQKTNDKVVNRLKEEGIDLNSLENGNKVTKDVQAQIIEVLKGKLLDSKPSKNKALKIKDANAIVNEVPNKQQTETKVDAKSKESSSKNSNGLNHSSEDKLLKELASADKKDTNSKFSKVMNFMNQFNKVDTASSVEGNVKPMVVNKNTLITDMIKSVKFMELNDMKEITVKVMPRELGEVVIKLTMENGLMKANITANNKEAYNLLNSNLQELNDKLGNGEIKIQNFTIDIYNGDTTFFSNEKNRQQNGQSTNKGKNSTISINEEDVQNIEHTKIIDNSNVNAFV